MAGLLFYVIRLQIHQQLYTMHHMLQTYFALLITFLCLSVTSSQAETDIAERKSDQQQLQLILQELEQATKQRQQQNRQFEALSHQLGCNWTLIRAYETCRQLHENDPDGHLKCSETAKQNVARCLRNGGKK